MSPQMADRKERIPFDLSGGEKWWRDHYDVLKEYGYQLRPRYHPDWKPSWSAKQVTVLREDSHPTYHPKVMDATRLSDNMRVAIKKLRKGSKELEIARYLGSEELRKDPRNMTVPVLDVFSEEESTMEFMVMPLLKPFDDPSFNSIDEVVDFIRQTLQGLSFMHERGVAHRDCSVLNTMMDATALFPKGFHAAAPLFDAGGKNLASPRHRRDVPSVKYYFTDFGISSWFESSTENRLVTGRDCQDKDLPEIHQSNPYDPFLSDIFILGNLYKHCFVSEFEDLEFLAPLAEAMTRKDPRDRPNINACLEMFYSIIKQQTPRFLRQILVRRCTSKYGRFVSRLDTMKREAAIIVRSFFCECLSHVESRRD